MWKWFKRACKVVVATVVTVATVVVAVSTGGIGGFLGGLGLAAFGGWRWIRSERIARQRAEANERLQQQRAEAARAEAERKKAIVLAQRERIVVMEAQNQAAEAAGRARDAQLNRLEAQLTQRQRENAILRAEVVEARTQNSVPVLLTPSHQNVGGISPLPPSRRARRTECPSAATIKSPSTSSCDWSTRQIEPGLFKTLQANGSIETRRSQAKPEEGSIVNTGRRSLRR